MCLETKGGTTMRAYIYIIFTLTLISKSVFSQEISYNDMLNKIDVLDSKLADRDKYVRIKTDKINTLKSLLSDTNIKFDERDLIYNQIIDEYLPFQLDSACYYIKKSIALSRSNNNSKAINDNLISLANLYASSGYYYESEIVLDSLIKIEQLNNNQLVNYYKASRKLYLEFAIYTIDENMRNFANEKSAYAEEMIIKLADKSSMDYIELMIDIALRNGEIDTAERYTTDAIQNFTHKDHKYALLSYYLGIIAGYQENVDKMLYWYAQSAIIDIELAVKDYAALSLIVGNLQYFDESIERKMDYMRYVIEDATFYNSRLRPWQTMAQLVELEKAYNYERSQTARLYRIVIAMILIFAIGLVFVLLFINKQRVRLSHAQSQISDAFENLSKVNNSLKNSNEALSSLNTKLVESDKVKEEYIGNFLLICSEHIEQIAKNQRHVKKMLRSGKIDELRKEYDSNELLDSETEKFYTLFDTTFIHLYPTFIDEFNSLLEDDIQYTPRKGEILSTELRIFALIRLGITDSQKISTLLRYSLSTIYNYRSKIKNRARVSKEEFDEQIKIIGSIRD